MAAVENSELASAGAARSFGATFNSAVCTLEYRADHLDRDEPASPVFDVVSVGDVDVFLYENPSLCWGRRTVEGIRADRVDAFVLCMPLHDTLELRQNGRHAMVAPGTFAFLATSRPYVSHCNESRSHGEYLAKISGDALRRRLPRIDEYCGRQLQITPGAGAMLKELFKLALSEGKLISGAYAYQFGSMLIDTACDATFNAPELLCTTPSVHQHSYDRIFERAMTYIDRRLGDPALKAEDIARYCESSRTTLYAAFASHGVTVASYVRDTRLQRCRDWLKNPAMRDKRIIDIAMYWGFNDSAYFSHAYKARFGVAPIRDRATI